MILTSTCEWQDRGAAPRKLSAARQPEHRIYVDSTSKVNGPSWPNGCHVCEVEIDPQTGAVEVVSYVSANDVGRVVNPMIVRGQLDGGAVQGLGQALCEEMVYDSGSGQAMTATFMDYAMPRIDMGVGFVHELDQSTPCQNNPLGAKGVGELGTIGAISPSSTRSSMRSREPVMVKRPAGSRCH